jgi:hypothetical protein
VSRLRPATPLAASLALSALLASGARTPAAFADGRDSARLLVERVAPAIVPVRVVMSAKISMQGQSFEIPEKNQTQFGTLVDPSGLVMTGTEEPIVRALEASRPGLSVSIAVRSLHVQLPGEPTERDAVLVAKDATLGLAFVQIVGAEGTKFPFVDLATGTTAAVGSNVYGVTRKSRAFDYAPDVRRGFVCGVFEQPRPMAMLAGDFQSFGMPLYDAEGRAVGVYAMQIGTDGISSLSAAMDAMTGGILPLSVIRASLASAKKRVPDALEKAKAGAAEKPAGDETKPPSPADGGAPAPVPTPTPTPRGVTSPR